MLFLHGVAYAHPNRDVLFANINLTILKQDKVALIGNNGTGKSSMLKILAGLLPPSEGIVRADSKPYYIPQIFGQFNDLTIAQALGIDGKLSALRAILEGIVTDENLTLLNDDWNIEERCQQAFSNWQLDEFELTEKMETLSGGQKTKVFLAGIMIHEPEILLLDEPSNHLDVSSRNILYQYIQFTTDTLVIVSHDRNLLNMLDTVFELSKRGITMYGGNYDFYREQKNAESEALNQDLKVKEKALRKAQEVERESIERQQKLDARGKKKQEKAGLPAILMGALKNNAEKSTSRIKGVHAEKVGSISQEISHLRRELPDIDKMKIGFDNSKLHQGKVLISTRDINFGYGDEMLWRQQLTIEITSGERIAFKGSNGAGKTTFIKLILGQLEPTHGLIFTAVSKAIYIDQDYSLIDDRLSVYEQAQRFNSGELQEHDIKIRLNRFLFTRESWDKPCEALSGGEKMRLMLCSLTISQQAPDMIILDEPTNNLDIQNTEILTAAINDYRGTLLVISHDEVFLDQIEVGRAIILAN